MMNPRIIPHKAENKTPIKVLIVDDDLRTRKGLRAMLGTAHLNAHDYMPTRIAIVSEAKNGLEALQMVETTKPDIVLMDLQMPLMDGLQATKKIKAVFPEIKIIILTVNTKKRTAAFEAGADAFLIKGDTTNELIDIIFKLTRNH